MCRPGPRLLPVAVKVKPLGASTVPSQKGPGGTSQAPVGTTRPPTAKRPASASPSQPPATAALHPACEATKRPRLVDTHAGSFPSSLAGPASGASSSGLGPAELPSSSGLSGQEPDNGGLSSLLGESV